MIMADDDTQAVTPRNMRPRSTPNAELNAQNRDKTLRDLGAGYPAPAVKDVPLRGYKRGGVVKAQGGGFMGSVAQGFQQGFGGDMPTKKDKKKTGSSGGSSPNAPAPPTNTAGADPTDAGNWAGDSGISASDPASGAAAGETYRRGGKIKAGSPSTHYCKGGKVISSRTF